MTDTALGAPRITIERKFDAPRELVFAAWTDPAQFGSWFGTAETTVTDVQMDLRVGGAWSARMVLGEGNEIPWHGTYTEIDPPGRLAMTLSDRPGEEFEPVTIDLVEVDGSTLMTFKQYGDHMDDAGYAAAEKGWQAFFDDLAAGLAAS
jgi:uncharacterized protein YndB with AHSA1/START domain